MVFSNAVFLFLFLPITLMGYYSPFCKSIQRKNIWLFIVSLGFYAWGEPVYIFLMLLSICVNHLFGILAGKYPKSRKGKIIVALACFFNLGVLFIFKYLAWILRDIIHYDVTNSAFAKLTLPIGISFYTFQSLSYVIDVFRGSEKPQTNILNTGLYISFFPQLIAGPIVRYGTVSVQLLEREHSSERFSVGVRRFIIGLSKKLLLANNIAPLAEHAFKALPTERSVLFAWSGVFAFMLQLYFDFSGYSDMAIGLGKMFGFDFLENFDYPYLSRNISEYWRRWHISLGQWFADYVFTPISSSFGKKIRKNLKPKIGMKASLKVEYVSSIFIVWILTGIWHGANWNYVLWGLMNFVFITIETFLSKKEHTKIGDLFRIIRTWFLMLLLLTMFNASSVTHALGYYSSLFHICGNSFTDSVGVYFLNQYKVFLIFGFIFCFPVFETIEDICCIKSVKAGNVFQPIKTVLLFLLLILDICYALGGGYNPFIYFNF